MVQTLRYHDVPYPRPGVQSAGHPGKHHQVRSEHIDQVGGGRGRCRFPPLGKDQNHFPAEKPSFDVFPHPERSLLLHLDRLQQAVEFLVHGTDDSYFHAFSRWFSRQR